MLFDETDPLIPHDYDYKEGIDDSSRKYIATTIEAIVGKLYILTKRLDLIKDLLDSWRQFKE